MLNNLNNLDNLGQMISCSTSFSALKDLIRDLDLEFEDALEI